MEKVLPLEARGLTRRVGGRILWQDLDLGLAPGERVAVAGPSGSGKSLLLKALVGLEPLDGGSVQWAERDLDAWSLPRLRGRVVLLPQAPRLPPGTVREAITGARSFAVNREGSSPPEADQQRAEALGRPHLMDASTATLSGGERQLAGLLRALAVEPLVLLLDEPSAALDADAVERVESLVLDWQRGDPRRAALWVSHDRQRLERLVDRTVEIGGDS